MIAALRALILIISVLAVLAAASAHAQTAAELKTWGEETLDQIERDFYMPGRGLYADEWRRAAPLDRKPAFMWGCGVMVPALTSGAKADEFKYFSRMSLYLQALDAYWAPGDNGIAGYDVLPLPKPPDRYFDDNCWMDLALVDAYDLTSDNTYLAKALDTFAFINSGADAKLGGGIYWRERDKASKNTCSNAPAIVAALRLYSATRKATFLVSARTLYDWTNAHLQDTDGLYWDNIKLNGDVEKTKWSYNSALMIRANILLHTATKEKRYLTEAERIASSAQARWIQADTGAVKDGGQFAHLLCEAFLFLYKADHNPRWRDAALKALAYVHGNLLDADGHYGDRWDTRVGAPLDKVSLLSQASVARAFLFAADTIKR